MVFCFIQVYDWLLIAPEANRRIVNLKGILCDVVLNKLLTIKWNAAIYVSTSCWSADLIWLDLKSALSRSNSQDFNIWAWRWRYFILDFLKLEIGYYESPLLTSSTPPPQQKQWLCFDLLFCDNLSWTKVGALKTLLSHSWGTCYTIWHIPRTLVV